MNDDTYERYIRFHTPDPQIAPREQAAMLAEDQAWVEQYARMHRFSWLTVLLPPLCFAPVLPGLAFLLGLLLYRTLVDPGLDIDRIVGNSFGGLALATLLFMAAWVLRNFLRDKHDRTNAYWQSMPEQGLVELERHSLVSGTSLWSNNYDPECNTLMQWTNDTLESVQDSGVTQWVLAKTTAGHWRVLKKGYTGHFSYEREGHMPAPDKQLQPLQELTIAFAPGTNIPLGQRFSGAPIPLVNTPYWMSRDELTHLIEIAHHWTFFPPDRYAVVNAQDAAWVQRLVDKALGSVGAQPALHSPAAS